MLGILFILIIGFYFNSQIPGEYNEFAQCISDTGAKMYGTNWCVHCQNQKVLFGKSFKNVNFVNCDFSRDECLKAGVSAFPTWIILEKNYVGELNLKELSKYTNCTI